VHKGDVLAVVDTTKAALDVECWHAGTVLDLLVERGQTVPVGALMARLLEPGEDAATVPPPPVAGAERAAPLPDAAPAPVPTAAAPPPGPARRAISPAARRRAAELGLALEGLAGTGPGGAVSLADVEAAATPEVAPPDRSAAIRGTIAAAMSRSKREVPHYYLADEVPLGAAVEWLRHTNAGRPVAERLLMAALYLRAVALAAVRHPAMNGWFVDGSFRPSAAVHLGMAISLRGGGLIAPAIHSVEQKSLADTMRALGDVVGRARAGRLRREELTDATITLTNLGDDGVTAVHGIIYAPQVALVGVGKVGERPWIVAGQVVSMPAVTLTLAADHRVSDGHTGARFLADVAARLQHPESL
jgi:pyruvate dehydrogenase E2 component (dihydrolipoamide acetyltransferase)